MKTIRLSRWGRKHLPFFRIVLTDHTKPVKSWYTDVLWRYNPVRHEQHLDIEKMSSLVENGVQMSSRVAKLAYNISKNELFKKYIDFKNTTKKSKDDN